MPSCTAALEGILAGQKSKVEKNALYNCLAERLIQLFREQDRRVLKLGFPVFTKQMFSVAEMQFVFRQRAAGGPMNPVVHLYSACD